MNLYQALFNGGGAVQGALGNITSILTPSVEDDTSALGFLFDALTFGLSLYAEGSVLTKALIRVAPQSTSLGSKLLPSSSSTGVFDSWTEASGEVGKYMLVGTEHWRRTFSRGITDPSIVGICERHCGCAFLSNKMHKYMLG